MSIKQRKLPRDLRKLRLSEIPGASHSTQTFVEFKPKGWIERSLLQEDETPVHPEFPNLGRFLSGEAIATLPNLLQDAAASMLVYARIKPGRSCQFWYELEHERNSAAPSSILGCKVFSTEFSAKRIERTLLRSANSAGCKLWPEENAILTFFPYDLKIGELPRLTKQDTIKQILSASIPNETGSLDETARPRIISYRPERNCLFRCALNQPISDRRHVFGRMHADESEARRVFEITKRIFDRSSTERSTLNVPEPLGLDRSSKTFFHAEVDGTTLTFKADQPELTQLVGQVASALADLHLIEGTFATAELRGFADLNSMADWLRFGYPILGQRLSNAINSLTRHHFDTVDGRLIHGDFSSNQVLVDDRRVTLIDWNSACVGDPHQDIASFRTRLHRFLPEEVARDLGERFVECYLHRRPSGIDPTRLIWFEAYNQMREAAAAVKKLKTGWLQRFEFWIERAETSIQRLATKTG